MGTTATARSSPTVMRADGVGREAPQGDLSHRRGRLGPGYAILVGIFGVALAGCASTPGSSGSAEPTATSSREPTAVVTPTPASTLSLQQEQAVEDATEAVRAYEQMYLDIFAGERALNDLYEVAAQPQLDQDLRTFQRSLVSGDTVEDTGPVVLADVEVKKVSLGGDQPTVTLVACVDGSQTSGTHDGQEWTGIRQTMRYRVIQTTYLPAPGWAVSKVLPPPGATGPTPC